METKVGSYILENGAGILVNGVRIINQNGVLGYENINEYKVSEEQNIKAFKVGDIILLSNGDKLELTNKGNLRFIKGSNKEVTPKTPIKESPEFPEVILDTSKPKITPEDYSSNDNRYSLALYVVALEKSGEPNNMKIAEGIRETLLKEASSVNPDNVGKLRSDRNRINR